MTGIEIGIKYAQPLIKFGNAVLALFKLKSENATLKAKVSEIEIEKSVAEKKIDSLNDQLKESERARSSLEASLSEKNHSDLLKEREFVARYNEENEQNQNIY